MHVLLSTKHFTLIDYRTILFCWAEPLEGGGWGREIQERERGRAETDY